MTIATSNRIVSKLVLSLQECLRCVMVRISYNREFSDESDMILVFLKCEIIPIDVLQLLVL
jgi:hypothetical protein